MNKYDPFISLYQINLTCFVNWLGGTGGVTPLTNMVPHALLVLRAMEEAARTIFATKVWKRDPLQEEVFKKACSPFLALVSLVEDDRSNRLQEETEENNFIEPEAPRGTKPWSRLSKPEPPGLPPPTTKAPTEDLQNEVVNTQQMCKLPSELFVLDLVSSKLRGLQYSMRRTEKTTTAF